MEYKIQPLEVNILKGVIGEHVARSFIRHTLCPQLVQTQQWDHAVFTHNRYKQSVKAGKEKLFSYDRFRDDFLEHGYYATHKLLAKYARAINVLTQNHCTPDGMILKVRFTGNLKRLKPYEIPITAAVPRRKPTTRRGALDVPMVEGDLEVVEIKCGRDAKLMSHQKIAYNDLIAQDVTLRMVRVKILSFDKNWFLVEHRQHTRLL